jgi:hypothetical protein
MAAIAVTYTLLAWNYGAGAVTRYGAGLSCCSFSATRPPSRRVFYLSHRRLIAIPFATQAQEAGRAYRIGAVSVNPRNAPIIVAMFAELRRLGFIEGQNLSAIAGGWHEHAGDLG